MKPIIDQNYEQNHSDRTSLFKDRIIPNVKSTAAGLAGGVGGAVIGAGLGMAGKKISTAALKKALTSETGKKISSTITNNAVKNPDIYLKAKMLKKPAKMFFSPEMSKTRSVAAAGAGALAMAPMGKEIARTATNVSSLQKQYRSQFGVDPTEQELLSAANLNMNSRVGRSVSKLFNTPNAMTKSTFRDSKLLNSSDDIQRTIGQTRMYDRSRDGQPKLASEIDSIIEKIAINKNTIEQTNKVISKVAPKVGTALGATAMIPSSYILGRQLTDDDTKHRGLKRAIGVATAAGTGAAIGRFISKDMSDALTGASNKILLNPKKTFMSGINNYAKTIRSMKMANDYYDEIEKRAIAIKPLVNSVKTLVKSSPKLNTVANTLKPLAKPAAIGAGVGALSGAANTVYQNSKISDPSQKRSLLGGVAKGALGGAATAGVYTAGKSFYNGFKGVK